MFGDEHEWGGNGFGLRRENSPRRTCATSVASGGLHLWTPSLQQDPRTGVLRGGGEVGDHLVDWETKSVVTVTVSLRDKGTLSGFKTISTTMNKPLWGINAQERSMRLQSQCN